MAEDHEYYLPGPNGKWDSLPIPDTLAEAQERIRVLQRALGFYSNIGSYDPEGVGNDIPNYVELMEDGGLRARIGRLAATRAEFDEWFLQARLETKNKRQ